MGDRRLAMTSGHQPPRGARHSADTLPLLPPGVNDGKARQRKSEEAAACITSERASPCTSLHPPPPHQAAARPGELK